MPKISQLDSDTSPTLDDYVAGVNVTPLRTMRYLFSKILTLLFNNIPTDSPAVGYDYVQSGGVWTADAAGSTRNASMSAMVAYINGRKISINAVSARTFTASKDTYVDLLDNGDGTGTLVYTEATNNSASAALAANSLRVAIIVTGATTIATAASVNQGQEDRILPIASSIPYAVTDSLGNLICPRDPQRMTLAYRQQPGAGQSSITTVTDITGLSAPLIASGTRKVKIDVQISISDSVSTDETRVSIKEGSTLLNMVQLLSSAGKSITHKVSWLGTPTAGLHTYKATVERVSGTGSLSTITDPTFPAFIEVKQA